MGNEIISMSIPQMDNDIDIQEAIKVILVTFGFEELDISVEYETDSIRYRFQHKDD